MLPDRYHPQEREAAIYKAWEEAGCFSTMPDRKKTYSVILPPPNVTGSLHIGHALNHTIQDILVRYHRMSGFDTLWLPGTDHAGIATQAVVERELAKDGIKRTELGREKFVAKVWDWKHQYGSRIYEQMRRLGDSCDWSKAAFTLDEGVSDAVKKVFVTLYNKGLIYRGLKLVNWSWKLETAISDLEVEHKEIRGTLYHIQYKVENIEQSLTVATTRPETLLGDVAVAVHPEDERYKDLIGKNVIVPFVNRLIPVISDESVDREFGTGAVKITPAHDFNDFKMGQKHGLGMIHLLTTDGKMNEHAAHFKGLRVTEARAKIVAELKDLGLLIKEDVHQHSVGFCSRTGVVVEPFLSNQWFMRAPELAKAARTAVVDGSIKFEPDQYAKTYLHWLDIIEDWCISRQLWWGHQIPAWHCKSCANLNVSESKPAKCSKCGSNDLQQDPDVLDTWFSSALWPFSTLGWPESSQDLERYYPTSVLVTGPDIIFFWVARMVMLGCEFTGKVPFKTVYINGIIRDASGKKMSKSTGNVLDPVELINENGADSLRLTLAALLQPGRDLKFNSDRLEGYRNFINKIWNASRFALIQIGDAEVTGTIDPNLLSEADTWILSKLKTVIDRAHADLANYRFADLAQSLYHYVWNDFCDWYIELFKIQSAHQTPEQLLNSKKVLALGLNYVTRLLHPIIPFVTEELYQKLPIKAAKFCAIDTYPESGPIAALIKKPAFEKEVELMKEVITAIRNIRGENLIKHGVAIQTTVITKDPTTLNLVKRYAPWVERLGKVTKLEFAPEMQTENCAVTPLRHSEFALDIVVPLEGLIDLHAEQQRLDKLIEKTQKDFSIVDGKLKNANFLQNAPPELVTTETALLHDITSRLQVLQSQRKRIIVK